RTTTEGTMRRSAYERRAGGISAEPILGRSAAVAGLARLAIFLLALLLAPGAASGQNVLCPQATPAPSGGSPVPGNIPSSASCCSEFQCAAGEASTGLQDDRRNVIIAVLDDHGHCQFGFMGGRCAAPATGHDALLRCE